MSKNWHWITRCARIGPTTRTAHQRYRLSHTLTRCLELSAVVEKWIKSSLVFAGDGPFAGSVLVFVGHVAYQEVLPLFRSQAYMPCEVT